MPKDALELDLRGLRCPLPALRTEKALKRALPGERLVVLSDDPLAGIDIPHLCRTAGHRLLEGGAGDGFRRFVIERGSVQAIGAQGRPARQNVDRSLDQAEGSE